MRTIAISIAAALAVSAGATSTAYAAKEKFERNKPHVNIGTIGHVDQGNSNNQEVQFQIQVGTSDMQNAENVRSQSKASKKISSQ